MRQKAMTPITLLLSALVGAFLLSGCSALGWFFETAAENERIAEAVVKNRTLAVIEQDPGRAQKVEDVTRKVKEIVESNPDVQLSQIRTEAERLVPWGKLTESEGALVRLVMDAVEAGISDARDSEALSDRQRVRLRVALGWIIEAAETVP